MSKIFFIVIVVVAIIGFSISAYVFSGTGMSIKNPISIELQSDNPVMDEIEKCIEKNIAGGSITMNSFNTNMLLTLKEAANNAQNDKELNEIRDRLHTLTDCKPNNQGFMP